jgi:hypothetical protein
MQNEDRKPIPVTPHATGKNNVHSYCSSTFGIINPTDVRLEKKKKKKKTESSNHQKHLLFLPTSGSNRNQSHPHPSGPQSHHSTPHHLRPDKSGRTSTIREIWYRQPTALPHTRSSQHIFHIYAPYPTTRPPCAHSSLNSHGYRFLRDNAVTTTMHQAYTNTLPKPQSHSPRLHIHRVSSHLFTPVSLSQAGKLWTPSLSTYAGQHLPSPSTRENATELRSYTASTIQGAQRHSP